MAWHAVWRGVARRGAAWRGVARRGAAWRGVVGEQGAGAKSLQRCAALARGTDMEALSHTRQCAVRLTLQAKSLQVVSMYKSLPADFEVALPDFEVTKAIGLRLGKCTGPIKKRTVRYGEVR